MSVATSPSVSDHEGVEAQIRVAANLSSSAVNKKPAAPKPVQASPQDFKSEKMRLKFYKTAADKITELQQNQQDLNSLKSLMEVARAGSKGMMHSKTKDIRSWMDFDKDLLKQTFVAINTAAVKLKEHKLSPEFKGRKTQAYKGLEESYQKAQQRAESARRKSTTKWANYYVKQLKTEKDAKEKARIERILRNSPDKNMNHNYMHLNDENGERCSSDEEVAKQVQKYVVNLLANNYEGTDMTYVKKCLAQENVKEKLIDDNQTFGIITEAEVRAVINRAKTGKANIGTSMNAIQLLINWDQHNYTERITLLLNNHISGKKIMEDINDVTMMPIPKTKTTTLASKYRWICICHIMQKIMDLIFVKRMQAIVQNRIGLAQCGFMPGREALDVSMAINRIVSLRRQKNKPTFILFADVIGAFPRMSREVMKESLRAFGMGDNGMKWIEAMYDKPMASTSINGIENAIQTTAGGIQGAVATPMLYIITKYMCDKAYAARQQEDQQVRRLQLRIHRGPAFMSPFAPDKNNPTVEGVYVDGLIYADDEATIAYSLKDIEYLAIQKTLHNRKFGQQTHVDGKKSRIMVIPGKKETHKEIVPIRMPGSSEEHFPFTDTMVHIGITYDKDWSFKQHCTKKLIMAEKEWSKSYHILQNGSVEIDTKMKVYERYILPHLLFGSELYTKNMLARIIEFHDDCMRKLDGYNSVQEMEDEEENMAGVRHEVGDISMKAHLQVRLLQWVGRATRKRQLGLFALKGTLTRHEEITTNMHKAATHTDHRIHHAIMALAKAVGAQTDDQNIYSQMQEGQTCETFKSKDIEKWLLEGHKVRRPSRFSSTCHICKQSGPFGIHQKGTPQVYSGLQKHHHYCTGFETRFWEYRKELLLKKQGGPLRCTNCQETETEAVKQGCRTVNSIGHNTRLTSPPKPSTTSSSSSSSTSSSSSSPFHPSSSKRRKTSTMTTPIKTVRQCQSCYAFWPTKNGITRCTNPKCSSTNFKRKPELTYSMHRKCKNCKLIYTWTDTQKKRIEELLLPFPDNTMHEYFEAMQDSVKKRREARKQQLNVGNQNFTCV